MARSAQLDRLERLVRGSRSYQARRVAAKLLGLSDELRVVPALIFALSDPDDVVREYARDGLRFISRKFEGFGMPDKPNNSELRQAQRKPGANGTSQCVRATSSWTRVNRCPT